MPQNASKPFPAGYINLQAVLCSAGLLSSEAPSHVHVLGNLEIGLNVLPAPPPPIAHLDDAPVTEEGGLLSS